MTHDGPRHGGRSGTALVIGAGFAGILAARALRAHYEHVVLLDRDEVPACASARRGVPHAAHAHALLSQGQQIVERLFPGVTRDLIARGIEVVDWGRDFAIFGKLGWMPGAALGLVTLGCARERLEHELRQRVLDDPGVLLLSGREIRGLLHDARGERVIGVSASRRDGELEQHGADLIVDASGRGSRARDWLASLGYERPAETRVASHRAYASRRYRRPAGRAQPWKALLQGTWAPQNPRGGLIYPMEDDCWQVTLVGAGGVVPPTDEQGLAAYAEAQPSRAIANALERAEPLTPIRGWRLTENRVVHFDALPRWPGGFVAIGDAVCAFNPVFAQGMTTASIGAALLGDWAGEASVEGRDCLRFQGSLAAAMAGPLFLAVCEDLRWSSTGGARTSLKMRLMQWYLDRVQTAAVSTPAMNRAHMAVWHLRAPIWSLFRPSVALRALAPCWSAA